MSPGKSKTVVASIKDRLGRTIVLYEKQWEHIVSRVDRDLDGRELAVMRAVDNADKRVAGTRPGTEVVYAENLGRARWLAVVVEYHGLQGRVLTAYPLSKEPKTDE